MKSYSDAGQIQAVLGLVEAIDRGGIDGFFVARLVKAAYDGDLAGSAL